MAVVTVRGGKFSYVFSSLMRKTLRELKKVYGGSEKYLNDLDRDPKAVAKRLREIAEGMSE